MVEDFNENYGFGWIKMFRSIKKHWIWSNNKPLTRFEAWCMMLFEVNHSDTKFNIGYEVFECNRGESLNSLETWAKLFNWNKSKVRRFFDLLSRDEMICTKNVQKTTHLTILNYDIYQNQRNGSETQVKRKRNGSDTKQEEKNKKNEKKRIKLHSDNFTNYQQIINLFDSKLITDNWIQCYDKLIRIDKYTENRIFQIVKEFRSDGNWWKDSGNFESLLKLRKKNKEGIKYIDLFDKQIKGKNTYAQLNL